MKTVAISEFKARCLGLLEEVKATGQELVVTKRGMPIVRVVAVEPAPSLEGSVTTLGADDELIAPLAHWDAG